MFAFKMKIKLRDNNFSVLLLSTTGPNVVNTYGRKCIAKKNISINYPIICNFVHETVESRNS
jgi:hypothetical protein